MSERDAPGSLPRAGLTWGRTSRPKPSWVVRTAFIAALLAAAVISSWDTPFPVSGAPIIQPGTAEQIQGSLRLSASAIERQDYFAYERTLDRRDPDFTACMRRQYERGQQRVDELMPLRLLEIEQVGNSVVRAYVQQRDGVVVHYFRRLVVINIWTRPPFDIRTTFDVWYLTRPEPGELAAGATLRRDARPDAC